MHLWVNKTFIKDVEQRLFSCVVCKKKWYINEKEALQAINEECYWAPQLRLERFVHSKQFGNIYWGKITMVISFWNNVKVSMNRLWLFPSSCFYIFKDTYSDTYNDMFTIIIITCFNERRWILFFKDISMYLLKLNSFSSLSVRKPQISYLFLLSNVR